MAYPAKRSYAGFVGFYDKPKKSSSDIPEVPLYQEARYENMIESCLKLFRNYRLLSEKIAKLYPNVKIYNATPNSFLDVFPTVNFEDIKFVKNLLKSKLSMLVISLDAFYETTYSKVKKTKIKLSDILPGLIYYLKHTKIKTYIQAIRHEKYEKNEIKKFIKFWGKYFKNNLISFDYKFLDTWSGHFSYATTRETLKEKNCSMKRSQTFQSNTKEKSCQYLAL